MFAIETNNLTKYYGKSRGIVELKLKVKKGEFFGFIGPNGAGICFGISAFLRRGSLGVGLGVVSAYLKYTKKDIV